MVGDPADGLAHLEAFKFGKKADVAQVHTENRHFGGMHQFGCAQDGTVSSEHDHDFRVFRHYWRLAAEIGRFDIVDDRHFEIGAPQLFDGFFDHRAAFTQTRMRHHHRMSGTDHRKPFRITGAPCEVPLPASVVEQMNE